MSKIANELKNMQSQPLLVVERKLVAGSLVLGFALLGVLIWISTRFFPA